MSGGQTGHAFGPRAGSITTLTPDDLVLSNYGPPVVEAVTLHSATFDKSTAATNVRSTGTFLKKGLVLYRIESGKFASVSMQNGNSPACIGSPAFHERMAGILFADVDMLDETGVVADKPGLLIRVGHLNFQKVHDAYGRLAPDLLSQFLQNNAKFNRTQFLFDMSFVSPGFDSPF